MRLSFTGVGTALITPFTTSGALDEAAVRRLAQRQVDAGVHFLVPCGTTGETPTLTPSERRRVVELVVEEAEGRALVLAGAGGYDTREVIHAVAEMRAAPARTASSPSRRTTTSRRRKGSTSTIKRDRRAARTLPIIVYNVPGPHRLQRRAGDARAARRRFRTSSASRKRRATSRRWPEICRAVPPDFIVLSGDDALTLPLMAIGGRGIISVASNEVPAEMVQMVEAAERGDFATARRWHEKLLPLMQVNFVESNPVPVKFAMARDGPVRRGLPAADGAAATGVAGKDSRRAEGLRPADRRWQIAARDAHAPAGHASPTLFAARARGADKAAAREAFFELQRALEPRRRSRRRARRERADRLARQRLGEAGHPARLPVRRHGRRLRRPRQVAVLRQGHDAAEEAGPRRRRAHRARRIDDSRRRVRRDERRLHAADVRQHRRVRRRRHARRLARARRIVRADRQARAPQRRRADRRRHRAGRRSCRSSSKTTCWSAATPASTKARSSSSAR